MVEFDLVRGGLHAPQPPLVPTLCVGTQSSTLCVVTLACGQKALDTERRKRVPTRSVGTRAWIIGLGGGVIEPRP
jgi:hypothetical protein